MTFSAESGAGPALKTLREGAVRVAHSIGFDARISKAEEGITLKPFMLREKLHPP
jgi:hypothetical protein